MKNFYAEGLGEERHRYKKAFLENLPLLSIVPETINLVNEIEKLVEKIVKISLENGYDRAKTKNIECQVDQLVYKIYNLAPKEIKIIEEN